jgi:hypothetical protein
VKIEHGTYTEAHTAVSGESYGDLTGTQYAFGSENPTTPNGKVFDGNLIGTNDTPSDFGAWYAHDGVGYTTTGQVGQNFGSDNRKRIDIYRILPLAASNSRDWDAKDWSFEGSNDNFVGPSVVLDTQTDQTFTYNKWNQYQIQNSTKYQYYRINVTANNGNPNYLIIQEVEMISTDCHAFSKVYTNNIDSGTEVTFLDAENEESTIVCEPGSMIPLVTTMATWDSSASGSIVVFR